MEALKRASEAIDEYQSLETIASEHRQLSINQLRWIVANKKRYGLDDAIKRVGKKLYFHMPSLANWISRQNA